MSLPTHTRIVIERDNVAEPSNELGFIGRLKNDLLFCVLVRLLFVQSKTEGQTEVSCADQRMF